MTLDEIIDKYGTHELDIDLVKREEEKTIIYAYCHQHDIDGQFMVNHYLEIIGTFNPVEMNVEDENDIFIHIGLITKIDDNLYEIVSAVFGDLIRFRVDSDLTVNELTEDMYDQRRYGDEND